MDNEKLVGATVLALMVDGLTLMILKTAGVIVWPWWVALLPLLVVAGVILFLLNAAAVCEVAAFVTRWVRNRRRIDDERSDQV